MLDGYNIDKNGVIKQSTYDIIEYNPDYIKTRYLTYPEKCVQMGYLRLGYIIGSIGRIPDSILDVGYGSGDFLKVCTNIVPKCFGFDITNLPPPDNVIGVDSIYNNKYDVITFFDVLEHFENIYDITKLQCNYIVISLPWCHYYSDEWFKNWKHRRPNEHLYHFNEKSLINFFNEIGYECLNYSEIEDTIRKTPEIKNILSAVFKKK
jgi:hypothetical protein